MLFFFLILMTIFQAIFDWSSVPMDFIDKSFARMSDLAKKQMPEGILTT